jgi:hypothetical protein
MFILTDGCSALDARASMLYAFAELVETLAPVIILSQSFIHNPIHILMWVRVDLSVPQGSFLGPTLYILFNTEIPSVLAKHQVMEHIHADDVQALGYGSPFEQIILVGTISMLSQDLHL